MDKKMENEMETGGITDMDVYISYIYTHICTYAGKQVCIIVYLEKELR